MDGDAVERALASADLLADVFDVTNDGAVTDDVNTSAAFDRARALVRPPVMLVPSLLDEQLVSAAVAGQSADDCAALADTLISRILRRQRVVQTVGTDDAYDAKRIRSVIARRVDGADTDEAAAIRLPAPIQVRPPSPPPPPLPTHDELYRHYVALGNPLHLAFAYAQFWEQTARNMHNEQTTRKRTAQRNAKRARDIAEWMAPPPPTKPAATSGDAHYRIAARMKRIQQDNSDDERHSVQQT